MGNGPQIVQELEANYFTSPSKQNSTDTTIPLIRGYNREREADAVARRILAYVESFQRLVTAMYVLCFASPKHMGIPLERSLLATEFRTLSTANGP